MEEHNLYAINFINATKTIKVSSKLILTWNIFLRLLKTLNPHKTEKHPTPSNNNNKILLKNITHFNLVRRTTPLKSKHSPMLLYIQ